MPLARDLAERAGRAGNLRLGAELLERLRQSAPADESVWRPLLEHYVEPERSRRPRASGGARRCRCCPTSDSAISCASRSPACAWRTTATTARRRRSLQDVLLEDPGQSEALLLLAGYYERTGSEGDLVDLLAQALDAAIAANDVESVVAAALRLGDVLERKDAERAAAIYERALAVVPRRSELLKRLLASRPAGDITAEHAARMEALLDVETGAEAGKLARELAAAWTALGDADAARRVLEKGHAQAAGDATFFAELEQLYRGKQDWSALADLYAAEAERRDGASEAAALLVEAASLRRGRLADVAGGLALLRRARARAPGRHPDRRPAGARAGRARGAGRRGRRGTFGAGGQQPRQTSSACRCTCCAPSWRRRGAITARR